MDKLQGPEIQGTGPHAAREKREDLPLEDLRPEELRLEEDLLGLVEEARHQASQDPFRNPVLTVALAISRRFDRGEISEENLEGLFVRLRESGAEGLLPARNLGLEYFRFDERRQAMVGERTGTSYGLGDTITVKLVEAAPVTGGLRFELAGGGKPGPKRGPEHRPARAAKGKSARFKPKRR